MCYSEVIIFISMYLITNPSNALLIWHFNSYQELDDCSCLSLFSRAERCDSWYFLIPICPYSHLFSNLPNVSMNMYNQSLDAWWPLQYLQTVGQLLVEPKVSFSISKQISYIRYDDWAKKLWSWNTCDRAGLSNESAEISIATLLLSNH